MAREHFRQEAQQPVHEIDVSTWLRNRLDRTRFRNIDLAVLASQRLPSGINTTYVFGEGVLKSIKGKVNPKHLDDCNMAKYMFSPGDKFGSLLDLVVGTHGTSFPLSQDKVAAVWRSP